MNSQDMIDRQTLRGLQLPDGLGFLLERGVLVFQRLMLYLQLLQRIDDILLAHRRKRRVGEDALVLIRCTWK
jgi:hypothetical protein